MIFFLLVPGLLFWASSSYAYIDPGTGGMVTSWLSYIGLFFVSAAAFISAYFIRPLCSLFRRLFGKEARPVGVSSRRYFIKWLFSALAVSAASVLIYRGIGRKANVAGIMPAAGGGKSPGGPAVNNGFDKSFRKALIVGIDGFDPDICDFLMSRGKMGHFAHLAASGVYSRMKTVVPPISPVVWTTMATGVNAGRHGIYDFMRFDRKKYLPYLSIIDGSPTLAGYRYCPVVKHESFWNTVSAEERFASVIRWPLTFPSPGIGGDVISGLGTPDIKGLLGSYRRFSDIPVPQSPHTADNFVVGRLNSNRFEAEFDGPPSISGSSLKEPFFVKIVDEKKAELLVQGRTCSLGKDSWSPWIEVDFKQGLGRRTRAITRIYAASFLPHLDLFMTSFQFDPMSPGQRISTPAEYSAALARDIGRFHTLGMPEDAKAVNENNLGPDAFWQEIEDIRQERERMLWREFRKFRQADSGVLAIVFDETDRAEHIFCNAEVQRQNGRVISVGPHIEKLYIDKDAMIGELMRQIEADTALMIVSDHGFKDFTRAVNLNSWLLDNGYLVLKEETAAENAGPLFSGVDWSKTKAYAYGYASLNINVKGREGQGIVDEKEKHGIEQELAQKLLSLTDPVDGSKVIRHIYPKSEVCSGVHAGELPDLFVGFNVPYRADWEGPIGGFSENVVSANNRPWGADHIFDASLVPGVFFSNFKVSHSPAVMDIAPTITALLGIKDHPAYDGKSLVG